MEENHPALEPQELQTPMKQGLGSASKQKSSSKSRVVSSRCTRSQVAPDWTVQEILIFVSQIAAIDADFSRSLPSPQKWKMIVDNCNALGVSRSLNQCRKKWESLLVDYNKINDWETKPGNDSYLSLESERKMEFRLPVIDAELFKAVDDLLKAQEEQSGSEPESESENAADKLDAIIDSDSEKPKRQRGRPRKKVKGSGGKMTEEDITLELHKKAELIHAIPKGDLCENKDDALNEPKNPENMLTIPTGDLNEEKDTILNASRNPEITLPVPRGGLNENKELALNGSKNPGSKKQKRGRGRPKKKVEGKELEMVVEDEEDEMVANLRENIEHIHAILRGDHKENKNHASNHSKNPAVLQTERIRRQGDQLIDVLGSLVSTLDQLSDRIQESV